MDARLRRWQLGGFIFTGIMGAALHFLYELRSLLLHVVEEDTRLLEREELVRISAKHT